LLKFFGFGRGNHKNKEVWWT